MAKIFLPQIFLSVTETGHITMTTTVLQDIGDSFVSLLPWRLPICTVQDTFQTFVLLSGVVESFPDGAPKFQCADAFPRHGFDAQPISDVLPYEITASREVYSPEQEIDSKYYKQRGVLT